MELTHDLHHGNKCEKPRQFAAVGALVISMAGGDTITSEGKVFFEMVDPVVEFESGKYRHMT